VKALKGAADPRAVEALSRALRDAAAEVRKGAAYSLRKIGGRRTVEALIDALASADDELTRVLIECLGGIGDPIALDPIRTVLSRAEGETRHIALRASGMLGDKAAARELVDLIFTGAPGDPKALYYASCREHGHSGPLPDDLRALEKSAGAEAIRPLIGLAEDSGYGAMIVQVVSKILERDAAAVDDELLVELARLQAVSWVHDSHFGTRTRFDGRRIIQEHFVGGGGARKVPADCSAVHVLAQKEIQRRIQGRTVMRKPAPD